MNLNIKATHITLTPDIQDYFEKRLLTLDRLINLDKDDIFIYAELGKNTHHQNGEIYTVDIKLNSGPHQYYVKAEGYDIKGAIDMVKDELAEKIKLNKNKRRSLIKRGATRVKNFLRFGRDSQSGNYGR